MAKSFNQIILDGDHIFDNSETQLQRSVKNAEEIIYDELIKLLNTVDVSAGRLQTNTKAENFLMSMDKKIYDALKKADYQNSVLRFTKKFDNVAENIIELHSKFNKLNIAESQISPFLKIEIRNTIEKLSGNGLQKDFIAPIRESLYRNIMLNADVTSIEKTLKEFTITSAKSDSKLMKYVNQVGRTAIQQFDGAVQASIAKELDFNAKRYVGSLIRDSRAQCRKWVTENNGILLVKDLAEEIAWAFTGSYQGQKCSGMIVGTTVDTFDIFRGGWGPCRHRSIPFNFVSK